MPVDRWETKNKNEQILYFRYRFLAIFIKHSAFAELWLFPKVQNRYSNCLEAFIFLDWISKFKEPLIKLYILVYCCFQQLLNVSLLHEPHKDEQYVSVYWCFNSYWAVPQDARVQAWPLHKQRLHVLCNGHWNLGSSLYHLLHGQRSEENKRTRQKIFQGKLAFMRCSSEINC